MVNVESIGEESGVEAGKDVVVVVSLLLVSDLSLLSRDRMSALALLGELILWVTSKIESPWDLVKLVVKVAGVLKTDENKRLVTVVVGPGCDSGGDGDNVTFLDGSHFLVSV